MRSAKEAVAIQEVHTLMRYLEICDGNMQEGSFRGLTCRCASLAPKFGTRAEIKNINSFRYVRRPSTTKSHARST